MYCQTCGKEIPPDAHLCPYCGVTTHPTQAITKKPRPNFGHIVLLVSVAALVLIIAACVGCYALSKTSTSSPTYQATATALAQTRATTPIPPPFPTNTSAAPLGPGPTPTQTPTPTPLPQVPSCAEMIRAHETMTDVQWDNYKDQASGTWLMDWSARIREVGDHSILAGGYPVHIDVTSDCSIYYVVPDEETALQYQKGQSITITGQVNFISPGLFGGMTIYLEDYTVEIR